MSIPVTLRSVLVSFYLNLSAYLFFFFFFFFSSPSSLSRVPCRYNARIRDISFVCAVARFTSDFHMLLPIDSASFSYNSHCHVKWCLPGPRSHQMIKWSLFILAPLLPRLLLFIQYFLFSSPPTSLLNYTLHAH